MENRVCIYNKLTGSGKVSLKADYKYWKDGRHLDIAIKWGAQVGEEDGKLTW